MFANGNTAIDGPPGAVRTSASLVTRFVVDASDAVTGAVKRYPRRGTVFDYLRFNIVQGRSNVADTSRE
jgi:hypothetical protein